MRQLTRTEAINFAASGKWREWSAEAIVAFQLFQECLCMDFGHYHQCLEQELGRPVWTHEFADQKRLQDEYRGARDKPTMQEIFDLIPGHLETLIVVRDS